jgi:hypothetical protein
MAAGLIVDSPSGISATARSQRIFFGGSGPLAPRSASPPRDSRPLVPPLKSEGSKGRSAQKRRFLRTNGGVSEGHFHRRSRTGKLRPSESRRAAEPRGAVARLPREGGGNGSDQGEIVFALSQVILRRGRDERRLPCALTPLRDGDASASSHGVQQPPPRSPMRTSAHHISIAGHSSACAVPGTQHWAIQELPRRQGHVNRLSSTTH